MEITEARKIVEKYDVQNQVDRESANRKEPGRHDIILECEISQKFLQDTKNLIKNKKEKIESEKCNNIDREEKLLQERCFDVRIKWGKEYCSECKYYDEIEKLQNDMKEIQEAIKCFDKCADRDYNTM